MPTNPPAYVTGEDIYRVDPADGRAWVNARPAAERGPLLHTPRERMRTDPATGRTVLSSRMARHVVAVARLEAERWIVDCPLADPRRDDRPCAGAQFWTPTDPRFRCCSCGNEAVGGQWLDVIGPMPDQRAEIETELLGRPVREQRSWVPGQSVATLRAETELLEAGAARGWTVDRTIAVSERLYEVLRSGGNRRDAVAAALMAGEALDEAPGRRG